MGWLARMLVKRSVAWWTIIVVALVAVGSLYQASRLQRDDDLLAFLPRDNPEVALFNDINRRFGTTDLALVGIEIDDPFTPGFIAALQRATRDLNDLGQINHAMSLTNVVDFTPDPMRGGVVTAPLVDHIPTSPEDQAALRAKVMSRDHIVGNLISADGRAVLLYCYLAYGANPKAVAEQIRDIVTEAFPGRLIYWGGSPFVSTYIYNTTQRDLLRLTPWAVLAIVLIMMLVFRDLVGTSVVLLATAIGTVFSLGLMRTLGVRFNIVLSAMPVVLCAVGSAYGVHVLARYYALAERRDADEALRTALLETGPVVIAAGLTTAASLLSFVCMDIQPLRTFGLFTAIGISASLVLALTFVPAVVRLTHLRHRQSSSERARRVMVGITLFAQRHRVAVGVPLLAVAVAGALLTSRVDTRVDDSTFFAAGSPPDRAEHFLSRHFGGGQFVQIFVRGDMNDPLVLREMRRIGDEIALAPGVSSVTHIGTILAQSNNAMTGQPRIPDTQAQVRLLYSFLDDPSVAQMMNQDRSQGLIMVKLAVNRAARIEQVLARIERIVDQSLVSHFEPVAGGSERGREALRDMVAWRVLALTHDFGASSKLHTAAELSAQLAGQAPAPDPRAVAARLARFLRSEESAVDLPAEQPDAAEQIAAAVAALGPAPAEHDVATEVARVLSTTAADPMVDDLVLAMGTPLEEMWAKERAAAWRAQLVRAAGIVPPAGDKGERFLAALQSALLDLQSPTAGVPAGAAAAGSIAMEVNGLPVMHRGLSVSVTQNQLFSLAFALALVIVIMSVMFRSVAAGLMATVPTLLTLLVVYGGMGLIGVNLDIGTSMLASLVLGAGVDYAVHLVAAWQAPRDGSIAEAAATAAGRTGAPIWTNAVMITAGFAVLTLGEARPLQNVGGLTAVAMMTAAAATFLAVPVLARRTSYAWVHEEAEAAQPAGDVRTIDDAGNRYGDTHSND